MVEFLNLWQVVLGSAVAFNVDAHVFKHFKLVTISFKLKYLSLMLLEEPKDWELRWRSFGMAQVGTGVGNLEQTQVVVFAEVVQAAQHVFTGPLLGCSQTSSAFHKVSVIASDVDH